MHLTSKTNFILLFHLFTFLRFICEEFLWGWINGWHPQWSRVKRQLTLARAHLSIPIKLQLQNTNHSIKPDANQVSNYQHFCKPHKHNVTHACKHSDRQADHSQINLHYLTVKKRKRWSLMLFHFFTEPTLANKCCCFSRIYRLDRSFPLTSSIRRSCKKQNTFNGFTFDFSKRSHS